VNCQSEQKVNGNLACHPALVLSTSSLPKYILSTWECMGNWSKSQNDWNSQCF